MTPDTDLRQDAEFSALGTASIPAADDFGFKGKVAAYSPMPRRFVIGSPQVLDAAGLLLGASIPLTREALTAGEAASGQQLAYVRP